MRDRNVKPESYKLDFDIDLKNFKFSVKEKIGIEIEKKTKKIEIHAVDLDVKSVKVDGVEVKYMLKNKKEILVLNLNKAVGGNAVLDIEFSGMISSGLAGLYRSKYVVNGEDKYMATTQMEPADARRVFPCFDEPEDKAVFEISLTVDKRLKAISNMPVVKEEKVGEKILYSFDRTPKMSTYLVYLGVGEFEFLEDKLGETGIRVITTPGKIKQGVFAVECTKKFLKYYNEYFGIKYPLPKIDHIAIPDFASGAMENWGAITYREVELLFDEKVNSVFRKQRIAEVIAHEMAHMWFGNLVTMKWWNDLWLNESFATWMAYKVVDYYFPEWEMWCKFVEDETIGAFSLDALKSSHPIKANVKEPHEVNQIFDAISYNKGGSLLRMLENHLGEDKFRKGLQRYMKDNQYGNAETVDLWRALEKEAGSGAGVEKMMGSWVDQVGYPILSVSKGDIGFRVRQNRFLLEGNGKGEWVIPLDVKLGGRRKNFLMDGDEIELSNGKEIKLNYGQTAFYRVNYESDVFEVIKSMIREGKLDGLDRWGIQNDVFSMVRASKVKVEEYLDLVEHYRGERNYLVCGDIVDNLNSILHISSGEFKEKVREIALGFDRGIFGWLGWDAKKEEDINYGALRSSVIVSLARLGDEDVLEEGRKRFNGFLKNSASVNPNLRGAVFNVVAWKGKSKEFEQFKKLYKSAKVPEDERRFLAALSGFENIGILKKTLDYSLSKNVRSQDVYIPVLSVARNSSGRKLAWDWVKDNWEELEKRYADGGGLKMFETFVRPIGVLNSREEESNAKRFLKGKKSAKLINSAVEQSLERLRINANMLEFNE